MAVPSPTVTVHCFGATLMLALVTVPEYEAAVPETVKKGLPDAAWKSVDVSVEP